ncbi:hypothetical protein D3P09_03600 [Paenibacillus pinisoli]|uniref:DAC domain-containing protein n=1 Tax=Paenibacillus pinisoli TaxID=1276110 RepID=A0A3A6PW90_9BACL|nr:hypothetical protein [Paenibacillus pinisoli]RJX41101.1 hypothetical protein D3P09_03600 [Paenibacillus pinisoli]
MKGQETNEIRWLDDNVKRLDELRSRFMGFEVVTKLEKTNRDSEYNVQSRTSFPRQIHAVNNKIAGDLLNASNRILENQLEATEGNFAQSLFLTHIKETALSLVFGSYNKATAEDKWRMFQFIEDLSEISSRTYESASVTLGILYFKEDAVDKAHKTFADKNMEFIPLDTAEPFMDLFNGEKAFLRLIDNRSMALVVNETFAVIGILRKKNDGRSICSELEDLIFTYNINAVLEQVYGDLIDKLGDLKQKVFREVKKQQPESTRKSVYQVINAYKELLLKNIEVIQLANKTREYPDFLYISVDNDRVNFYTQSRMVVSLVNGIWKMRHYDLFVASILQKLMISKLPFYAALGADAFKKHMTRAFKGYNRLFRTFIDLSREQKSSVYLIIDTPDILHGIAESKTAKLLKGTGFLHSERKRRSLLAIKKGKKNANLIDLDPYLIKSLSAIDGAVVLDSNLNILSFGETISVSPGQSYNGTFGTGSTAAQFASKHGIAVKVSEDGDITLFIDQKKILKL